ncbi:hypothetical protein [Bradyrhizobium sp. STM 3809]|uniref:hypothetical protein n=1 Tax=Bradyrhizobium sp. STM 3809 TaxID=551936 RepID=UPI0002408CD0|nr:hypothetical protein [Bradyrhizobium sp. STM 3809]CCD99986.1 hypothetical protein BRAS3809_3110010 [Bradyrhizobium sp. STM 3809]
MNDELAADADAILAAGGSDENGRLRDEPKDEYYPGDEVRHRDFFGRSADTLAPDDEEREVFNGYGESTETINQVAASTEALAAKLSAEGKIERAAEEARNARELRELAKRRLARKVLNTHAIFDGKLSDAVLYGDWPGTWALLISVIRDNEADHALRVAGVKAAIEIAPLAGADTGEDFDAAWIAKAADIPLRTAQDLMKSANSLESGLATLLVGTEHGGRKAVRQLGAMTPAKRRKAVDALKEHLTLHMLEFAGKREKSKHARSICLSELKVLSRLGLNNPEGWAALTEQSAKAGKAWLAAALDRVEAAERKYSGKAGPDAKTKGLRVLPSLTMQRLANERIYEL